MRCGRQAPIMCTPPSTCTISPVVRGKKSDSMPTTPRPHVLRVGQVPADRGAVVPHVRQLLEAGDGLGGHRLDRAGRDQVAADTLGAQVTREVAVGALQRRLGHAHPVVLRPGDLRVEGEADDRAAVLHERQAGHGQRLVRVRRDLHRGAHVRPLRLQEVEGALRAEGDGVHDAVDAGALALDLADLVGEPVQLLLVGDVQLDHRRRLGQPLGDPLDEGELARSR